jgi:uncharacterized protein (DUF2147 family)
MKSSILTAFLLIFSLIFSLSSIAANNSPVGYWKTVDDKTGEVLSIVQIYNVDNALEGKIVKIMPVLDQKSTDRCTHCKGELANKPILGLRILWGMQPIDDQTWGNGHVLDPKSGNIYRGKMMLIDNGEILRLRGYIGIPEIGRAQIWKRTGKP